MARIAAIGTAVPPHCYRQQDLRAEAERHFKSGIEDIGRLAAVFDSVQIGQRHFCVPLEWFHHDHSFTEKNNQYVRWAEELAIQAIESCLNRVGIQPDEVDHLLFVSSSGLSTPSIDARIINRLGFKPSVKRTPIFGLGCAGGAAGLSRCLDLARGAPRQRILLIVVEISSLTFQFGDLSKSNLVASALFADGSAAVLVCGSDCPEQGLEIVDSQSTLWPNTLDIMGWDFSEKGLHVVLSRNLPAVLSRHIRSNVEEFLARNFLGIEAISRFIIHPGGAKVLAAFQKSLGLKNGELEHSRFVLENYGNMSAPTMLFILNQLLQAGAPHSAYGLCAAFGPGFSSELLLLKW
ncbi:MAG: type III polyketide synthase [Acidobacteriota bacterium]